MFYEIYVQPETGVNGGPLTVHERGPNGELGWLDKDEAIEVAKAKRRLYRNINFVVRGEDAGRAAEIVYRTIDDDALQEETREWPFKP